MASNVNIDNLLEATYEILITKGIKSTTMDSIAKRLKISKRTLYEMFDNKADLVTQTLEHHHAKMREEATRIIQAAPNIMEGLLHIINLHRDDIRRVNIEFFKDLDRLYPEMKNDYETRREKVRHEMLDTFNEGVRQGLFREDINFEALTFILQLVMEAIKSPLVAIPDGIGFVDIFDTMTLASLRTIATPAGNKILDNIYSSSLKTNTDQSTH